MPTIDLVVDEDRLERMRAKSGRTLDGLRETANVASALVLREAATRYGGTRLGYLWAFIEPTLFFIIFLGIRGLIRDSVPFGESALIFLVTGLTTVRAFLAVARKGVGVIRGNAALMSFPMIQPIDLILARIAIEILTMSIVLVVFYALIVGWSDAVRINDFTEFTYAILATFLLAGGVGVFGAVFVVIFPPYKILLPLISFPLLLFSGVFYVPSLLPPFAIELLSWNPVLHCVEWFRVSIYMDYPAVLDRSYPIVFGAVALWLGLIMTRLFMVRILE